MQKLMLLRSSKITTPILVFIFGFFAVPFNQLDSLKLMPGDLADARLVNLFLEYNFLYLNGKIQSLWNLPFYYPFPYIGGFSETLIGASPLYIIARFFNNDPFGSFQIWFLCGYAVNYLASYYAFRRLGLNSISSSVGAFIFTFSLPTTAHAIHSQLHYRFGIPLSTVLFLEFLKNKDWRTFVYSNCWLVWQFFCSIYMGFFASIIIIAVFLAYIFSSIRLKHNLKNLFQEFKFSWSIQKYKIKILIFGSLILLTFLVILLFTPYLIVNILYGFERGWLEISTMLPRPQSYFLADSSYLYKVWNSNVFDGLPMRWEHQMFVGAATLSLILFGFIIGNYKDDGITYNIMVGVIAIVFLSTLYIGGASVWYLFHKLPLFSSIRAVTRIDQALLFPMGFLAALAVHKMTIKYFWSSKATIVILLPLLLVEAGYSNMVTSPKEEWIHRLESKKNTLPKTLEENSILFFAQKNEPFVYEEIDSMWLSALNGLPTLNGYSGNHPPGYTMRFGNSCSELPKRIVSFLEFSDIKLNKNNYSTFIDKVIPVGFEGCSIDDWRELKQFSISKQPIDAGIFEQISFNNSKLLKINNQTIIEFYVQNQSLANIPSISSSGHPIRFSWRFMGEDGIWKSGWDNRFDLPFDIPAGHEARIRIPLDETELLNSSEVHVSIVQEGVFWGHDLGIEPIILNIYTKPNR